ncbi:hypothetical protein BD779DRAFT_1446664 [Infundibulicybe gibba]|nr:hypothetical protein BD779DRAFT_1446664 [Infundibulicybe gibba]
MSITAGILFATITGRWFINITLAFDAFIQPTSPGYCVTPTSLNPAERVYLNLPHPKNVMTSALYVTMTIVGDAFMVYRLYIVWARNKAIIVFPSLLCIALAATGGMVTYLFSQAKTPIFDTAGAWITASFILTFLCNLYSTSLIALRIHWSNRSLGRAPTDGMMKITEILVESAVLYSVCVVLSLGTYVGGSNAQFVFVAAVSCLLLFYRKLIITTR